MMMRKSKPTVGFQVNGSSGAGGEEEWEMRPGGMLVQKRSSVSDRDVAPAPMIKVRVKHGSIYHEVNISSQATFGELKKLLTGPTGFHHEDQKLIYKDKERDSKAFLDLTGVKDRSKMVLVEDPISQEKRYLELLRTSKMEKTSKSISEISLEVDRLGRQVAVLDSIILKGGKVVESDLLNLIELLMNELLKLDGIVADGDVKLQRKMQVRRVQKYVETLDVLKIKNSRLNSNGAQKPTPNQQRTPNGTRLKPIQENQQRYSGGHLPIHQQQPPRHSASGAAVVNTKWETFDSNRATSKSEATATKNSVHSKFNWERFE